MLKRRQSSGFTLVELMIAIVILGILLSLAFPSFKQLLMNYQIRALTESILSGLQLARATAVQRNENVQFVLAADAGWTVTTQSPAVLIQSRAAAETSSLLTAVTVPDTSTMVTFNGLGRVAANDPASLSITAINVDVPTTVMPASESRDLSIRILPGGLIKMCNPNITDTTDVTFCP
jgi:type IV fimbrial biogenesis protein FimT